MIRATRETRHREGTFLACYVRSKGGYSLTNLYPLSFMHFTITLWSGSVDMGPVGGVGFGGMDCSQTTSAAATSSAVFPFCTHRSVAHPAIRIAAHMTMYRAITISMAMP